MVRPMKYTKNELEQKVNNYFDKRLNTEKKVNFCSIRDLCRFLDIDNQTFYNYKKRPGYSAILKRAENKIISVWEQQLMLPGRNTVGAIFYLKNYGGMADKVEHQHSGKVEHEHRPKLDDLPQDKLEQLAAALGDLGQDNVIDVTPEEEDNN